jgi:hypothetical protein
MFASVYCGAVLQEAAAIITATNAATWATEFSLRVSTTHAATCAREVNPNFVSRCSTWPPSGARGNYQASSDLLIRQALGNQISNLQLTPCQVCGGTARDRLRRMKLLTQGIGDRGVET